MGLHMALCRGPVDAVLQINAGDRTAWSGNVTASATVAINSPELFGGDDREGGIVGDLDVMMGEDAQAANAYLTTVQGSPQPAYRGLLGVVFHKNQPAVMLSGIATGGQLASNNPYIKPWAFRLRRILKGWQSDSVWYSAKAAITLPSGAGQAMNPAHIVYECLTNTEWGMGYGTSLIDDSNFRSAADAFHGEGLGLCIQWTQQQPIEQFIRQIMDHCGAVLAQDRRTGLFKLKPLRSDYVVGSLPLYDETNIITLDSYQRPAIPDAVNEITVSYDDTTTGKRGSVTVQNLANITSQGGIVNQPRSYPGIPTAALALRAAMRDLAAVSTPLAKVRFKGNRKAYALLPGDVIKLSWAKLGITNLVLRVLRIDTGTLVNGEIEVEASEDVYGFPAASYAAQPPSGWTSPNAAPAVASSRIVEEAGYYEVQRVLGADAAAAMPSDQGYTIAAAVRPSGDSIDFGMSARVGAAAYEERDRGAFCPSGTLTAAIAPGDTSATLTGLVDSDLIVAGGFAQIGAEIVRIDTFNPNTGAITLGRGVAGTVAIAHSLGARMYFRDGFTAVDETERIDAETVNVKLTTRTGLGQLAEGSAPTDSVVMDQRAYRPYPPGRLRIASLTYPTSLNNTVPVVSWSHRDRLQQNLQGDESTNIGPEASTTYTVEISNADTSTVLVTSTGITGTSYTPALFAGTFNMRVRVWSVRSSLNSYQTHSWTFAYTASVASGVTLTATASLIPGSATGT